MALKITSGGSSIKINKVTFDGEINSFACFENDDDEPIFYFKLPFEIEELPNDDFSEKIYLFKNELFENERLIKLKLKEKPEDNKLVGYMFSLRDLVNQPNVFKNIHLKKIAFNTINKLLSETDLSLKSKKVDYRSDSDYNIFDFYDESLIVVCVCDQFVNFQNYNFKDYLPSFSKYGFKFSHNNEFYSTETSCKVTRQNYINIDTALTLKIPNNSLHTNYFIRSLLQNDLITSNNEIGRFHIYYQVIEMLMEKVYKNEVQEKIIAKFNTLSSFDAKELFRETMRDSYSLEKLFGGAYSTLDSDIVDELKTNIDVFLKYVAVDYNGKETYGSIYKVRNTLFHGYSKILENSSLDKEKINSYLKLVNDSFEYLINDVILTYSKPI
ncbi:MAG: hypothetical protein LBJ04_17740 [Sphingobacterium sp.]|jgi:hypothetical protein|nr:hypothetical protein [Sphingobacterium sp.]